MIGLLEVSIAQVDLLSLLSFFGFGDFRNSIMAQRKRVRVGYAYSLHIFGSLNLSNLSKTP